MRVANEINLSRLLRVFVVIALAAGQTFLAVHACDTSVNELANRAIVTTQTATRVASATVRRALGGAGYLPQRANVDCADSAARVVLPGEPAVLPNRPRVISRVGTDFPKPFFADRLRVSGFGMADHGEVVSRWLGNPRELNSPPHTILHCCWRI